MLMRDVEVGLCHFSGKQQTIFITTFCGAKFLEHVCAQHFSEGVRCVNSAIYNDMSDMYALGGLLGIQCLTEHSTSGHGSGRRMLTRITTDRGSS